MENSTTIEISRDTHQLYSGMKNPGESFDKLLIRLAVSIKENDSDLLTQEDILEIEQSVQEMKKGNYKTQAEMKAKYGLK